MGSESRLHELPVPVTEVVATALGSAHRDDPVTPRTGGPAGNARLTAWLGLWLLVLFFVEGVTLLSLHAMISVHILIGAALLPPVLLKTATTGWRMIRYYLGSPEYRQAGPPPLLLRLLGPLVVLTGLAVLGTGLALIAVGTSGLYPFVTVAGFGISALTLHQAAFAAWLVITGLHVLGRTVPALQLARGAAPPRTRVPGARSRNWLLSVVLIGGVAVGVVVLRLSDAWTSQGFWGR